MSSLTGASTSSTATTPEAAEELVDVDGVSAVVSDVVVAASVVAVVVVVVSFVVVVACSGLLCDVAVDVMATRAGATFVSLLDDDDATEVPFGEFFAVACCPPRLCGEATARTRKLLKLLCLLKG